MLFSLYTYHFAPACNVLHSMSGRLYTVLMPSARRLLSKIYHLKSGFTLIELLVVISIIGILAAITTASYTQAQKKARDGKRKTDLKATQQALELFFQTNGHYPVSLISYVIKCNVPGDIHAVVWGGDFTCAGITYMNPLPKDPDSPTNFYRYVSTGTTTYQINSIIENTNDPDYCNPATTDCVATGKLPCQPYTNFNFCVINP